MEGHEENKTTPRKVPPAGLSIAAAIVIAAILLFIGMKEMSIGLQTIGAGLQAQANAQRDAASIQVAGENAYPPIMDGNQAANYLGISVDQLVFLADPISGSNLPVLKINGSMRFSKSALDEWMKTPHSY